MGKARVFFKDRAGNVILRRFIKTRGVIQFSGKNREGKLLSKSTLNKLAKKAMMAHRRRKKR